MRRLALLFFIFLSSVGHAAEDKLTFIVNSANPVKEISASRLADFYFKRRTHWPSGSPVRFIDRSDDMARNLFLQNILNRSSQEVDLYWIGQKLYTGHSAPIRVKSDRLVVEFVGRFEGAIGYITGPLPEGASGVKAIEVQ